MPETPFDSVEGAHEYVGLLLEAVREARGEVAHDLHEAKVGGAVRRAEALHLVMWKLERLEGQLGTSRQLLNDLRRLRRLLLGDDGGPGAADGDDLGDEPWGA
jgi:hypothetical protein